MAHNSAHHSILIDVLQMITSKGRKLLSAAKPGGLMAWGRHEMETFSALLAICEGNSPVPGEFPAQRPVTRSLDVFMVLHPNKRLGKQWLGWWFETPSCPIGRHRNDSLKHGSWQVLILRNVRRNSLKMVSNFFYIQKTNSLFHIYFYFENAVNTYNIHIPWLTLCFNTLGPDQTFVILETTSLSQRLLYRFNWTFHWNLPTGVLMKMSQYSCR